jgi:hypothetical protein
MNARLQLIAFAAVSILGAAMTSHGGLAGIDVPVPGTSLRLHDAAGPQGRRTYVALRDAADAVPLPDPRITGATLYVGRVGVGEVTALDLPADGWSGTGAAPTDFKYKSRSGAVVAARIIDGRSIRLSARGDGTYPLGGVPQGGVGVIIDVGGVRFCGFFGGQISKDDGRSFRARNAPAPAGGCPALGTTTTTSTTSSTSSSSTTTSSSTSTTETSTTSTTSTTFIGIEVEVTCTCTYTPAECGGQRSEGSDCVHSCSEVVCGCEPKPGCTVTPVLVCTPTGATCEGF